MTPRMRKLVQHKDARVMLQEEVNESALRLKKAKFGHSLIDIVPDHKHQFYLPNKQNYFPKERPSVIGKTQNSRSQLQTHKQSQSLASRMESDHTPIFKSNKIRAAIELNRSYNVTAAGKGDPSFMTEPPMATLVEQKARSNASAA
jgi:hypothetical protein